MNNPHKALSAFIKFSLSLSLSLWCSLPLNLLCSFDLVLHTFPPHDKINTVYNDFFFLPLLFLYWNSMQQDPCPMPQFSDLSCFFCYNVISLLELNFYFYFRHWVARQVEKIWRIEMNESRVERYIWRHTLTVVIMATLIYS